MSNQIYKRRYEELCKSYDKGPAYIYELALHFLNDYPEHSGATIALGVSLVEMASASRPTTWRKRFKRQEFQQKNLQNTLMSKKEIATGVVHSVPGDMREALIADRVALALWEDITPLARNEWICWVEDAKKAETRLRRIKRTCTDLKKGKRRPCCWPGCPHRGKKGKGA